MHYKTKNQRHENVIKLRLNDDQLKMLEAYAQYNDLPLAVAARQFLKLGSDTVFASDDQFSIERALN